MMRYALVLDKMAEFQDCITDPNGQCVTCCTHSDGFNLASEKLQQISRIVQTQAQTSFEGILESIKMHRELIHAVHELSNRRKAALSAVNIPSLAERNAENKRRLEVSGFSLPFEQVDKIKMQIQVDESSIQSQKIRVEFVRHWYMLSVSCSHRTISSMFEEINLYLSRKSLLFDSHMQFANQQSGSSEIVGYARKRFTLIFVSVQIGKGSASS